MLGFGVTSAGLAYLIKPILDDVLIQNVNLGLMAGVTLGGRIKSERKNGSRIFKDNYDPAPILGLQGGFRF